MLITKRSDYALRICRALRDGKTHNVRQICEDEDIPKAFAYKIIREMELNGIVKSERGNKGGYCLLKKLDDITVYDIVSITEEDLAIVHCMKNECNRNKDICCKIHLEMRRIQNIMESELKKSSLAQIIDS